jgi:cell division transport system permease protein
MHLINSVRLAYVSVVRNKGGSALAVATMAFMLTALSLFILLADGMNHAAAGLEAKANLVADIGDNYSPTDALEVARYLDWRWPGVRVSYVSKAQAADRFRKTFAGNSAMLAALEGNPLPASLEVRVRDATVLSRIDTVLRHDRRVTHLIFNPNLTHKLVEITTLVRIVGISLVVGLAFLALIIIVNTIQFAVQARAEEIEVMRFVGASRAFVRDPFIAEGVGLGLAGGILATLMAVTFYLPVLHGIMAGSGTNALSLLPVNTNPSFVLQVTGVVLAVGAGIGAAGSYISVRRYSRV